MTEFKSTLIDLPENDDTMDCLECDNGLDRDGELCFYCNGIGVISEYSYKDIKSLERDESNL